MATMIKIVVSACLLGAPVRPDGSDRKSNDAILQRWLEEGRVVSACPEMLGGLGTPRLPAEIRPEGDQRRVITTGGHDVTSAFETGAATVRDLAQADGIRIAILKDGSPSCGSSFIYDGTFSKARIAGEGITAAMLRKSGLMVFSENELEAADEWIARAQSGAGPES
jgi:uncharacterized protein YbbK (DUF523 family)